MATNFIDDYLLYQSGNEGSKQHHVWAALSILSATAGRRYYLDYKDPNAYGQLAYNPNILCCLVAPQGGRKSFCKDEAQSLLSAVFPEYPISYSVETVAGLCEFLGSPDSERLYTDENQIAHTWRPLFLPINELNNFLSINPQEMIDFMVDISDRKFYKRRTKNAGTFEITNPYLTVLACATTEYIVDQLKGKILSGGLARRMVFVNEYQTPPRIAFPVIPSGGKEAITRAAAHLKSITQDAGGISFEDVATKNWYELWYRTLKLNDDPLLRGFDMSKHVQVLRLAMLRGLGEYPLQKKLTKTTLQWAVQTIDNVIPGMTKLFMSAGKNEYVVQQKGMLDYVERAGGIISQKQLMRLCEKDLDGLRYMTAERFLIDSGQLISKVMKIGDAERRMILTPAKLDELEKQSNGEPKQ